MLMSKNEFEIIEILKKHKKPITVSEILNSTLVNKTTVYRNLEKLVSEGKVLEVNISTQKTFYELNSHDHHHHLVCKSCNAIQDFEEQNLENAISDFEKQILESGFDIKSHNLEFFGYCNKCVQT